MFILLFTHFLLPLPLHTHPALCNYAVLHVGFYVRHVLRPVDGQSEVMLKGARVRLTDGLLLPHRQVSSCPDPRVQARRRGNQDFIVSRAAELAVWRETLLLLVHQEVGIPDS